MRYILLIICFCVVLSSCRKEKLDGDKSIFIGTWTIDHSIRTKNESGIFGGTITDTIYHTNPQYIYGLTFLEKGKMRTLKSDIEIDEYRIRFDRFQTYEEASSKPDYWFTITLKGGPIRTLKGIVNTDTLMIEGNKTLIPTQVDGYTYAHYYLKSN